jgi:hypothetical protein
MVYLSGCWLLFKWVFLSILLRQLWTIWHTPYPTPYRQLDYFMKEWQLEDKDGNIAKFEKQRILLSAGFFFLLELKEKKCKKILIVFRDQIQKEDLRVLKLIEKVG